MQKNKEPVIYRIDKLPKFIQIAVSDLWERNKIPPEEMAKKNLVFTYFDGIYTATRMDTDLFVHESVHYIRQGGGMDEMRAKEWWLRYCDDPKFRYEEELLAYREQYAYILRHFKGNRAVAFPHLKRLATDLSGPIYGHLCSFQDAMTAISKK